MSFLSRLNPFRPATPDERATRDAKKEAKAAKALARAQEYANRPGRGVWQDSVSDEAMQHVLDH